MMLSFGLTPIGVFPMALAADRAGAANAILAASLILILVVVGFFLFSKTLRELDKSVAGALKKPIKKSTG